MSLSLWEFICLSGNLQCCASGSSSRFTQRFNSIYAKSSVSSLKWMTTKRMGVQPFLSGFNKLIINDPVYAITVTISDNMTLLICFYLAKNITQIFVVGWRTLCLKIYSPKDLTIWHLMFCIWWSAWSAVFITLQVDLHSGLCRNKHITENTRARSHTEGSLSAISRVVRKLHGHSLSSSSDASLLVWVNSKHLRFNWQRPGKQGRQEVAEGNVCFMWVLVSYSMSGQFCGFSSRPPSMTKRSTCSLDRPW